MPVHVMNIATISLRRSARVLPFLLILAAPVCAQGLDGLDWMAGHWSAASATGVSEEQWIPPQGGLMLGMHRDVRAGKGTFFEYLRIEARGDSVLYVASPMGRGETAFLLVEQREHFARFENQAHDYPVTIEYERSGADELTARIAGKDGRKPRSWVFRRTP